MVSCGVVTAGVVTSGVVTAGVVISGVVTLEVVSLVVPEVVVCVVPFPTVDVSFGKDVVSLSDVGEFSVVVYGEERSVVSPFASSVP